MGFTLVAAARRDDLAWLAYPKTGRLGTDFSRDSLVARLQKVNIDGAWSTARFRPAR